MMMKSVFLSLLLAAPSAVVGQQLSLFDPTVKWSTSLDGKSIGDGNGVSLSPDDTHLYITFADGSLEVLDSSDGTSKYNYTPNPVADGWTTSCTSGVAYGSDYVVYAVVDTAPLGIVEDSTSRIIAISHPDNSLLWESDPIPGVIQGTPAVGMSTDMAGNMYIYFTHNHNMDAIDASEAYGSFSIMQASSGDVIFTEDAGNSTSDPEPGRLDTLQATYGPVGIATLPLFGRYPGGLDNANDLLLWSTSIENGEGPNGYTRAFQIPSLFSPEFTADLFTTFLREVRWNSVLAPIFSTDGLKAIFGVRENSIRGWTATAQNSNDFSENGNIVESVTANEATPREALQNSPVFSKSEEVFFVAGYTDLFMLDTNDGSDLWSVEGGEDAAVISSSPKVDPQDRWVYITKADGTVSAYTQLAGEEFWTVTCESLASDPPCVGDLQGEFSLSGDGLTLYFGDALGSIVALDLDPAVNPGTLAPTMSPTDTASASPSAVPSDYPSLAPTFFGQTYSPTPSPTKMPVTDTPTASPIDAPVATNPVETTPPSVETPVDGDGATLDGAFSLDLSLLQVVTTLLCLVAALL